MPFFVSMITIHKAASEDIEDLAALFNDYRIFYEQASDLKAAADFLRRRMENDQSVIFIARLDGASVGFTQLYPVYSSVSLLPLHILNDLYVSEQSRGLGIATLLINEAKSYVMGVGGKGLTLETHQDNPAQKLYERLDFVKDETYYHYAWKNTSM